MGFVEAILEDAAHARKRGGVKKHLLEKRLRRIHHPCAY